MPPARLLHLILLALVLVLVLLLALVLLVLRHPHLQWQLVLLQLLRLLQPQQLSSLLCQYRHASCQTPPLLSHQPAGCQ
jgi:hypothetical protein